MNRIPVLAIAAAFILGASGDDVGAQGSRETMIDCHVRAIVEVNVAAEEAGKLVMLAVEEGDTVSEDAVIAQIDDKDAQHHAFKDPPEAAPAPVLQSHGDIACKLRSMRQRVEDQQRRPLRVCFKAADIEKQEHIEHRQSEIKSTHKPARFHQSFISGIVPIFLDRYHDFPKHLSAQIKRIEGHGEPDGIGEE